MKVDKILSKIEGINPLYFVVGIFGFFAVVTVINMTISKQGGYVMEIPKAELKPITDEEFLSLIPKPAPEPEPIPEPEPEPEPVVEEILPPPQASSWFNFSTPKVDEEAKKKRDLIASLNRQKAVQVWYDQRQYMNDYENHPSVQMREKAKMKAEKKDFGNKSQFCQKGGCSDTTKPTLLDRTLTKGTYIHAVLTETINSEIPSKVVIAEITKDVYAYHGGDILIPKNSVAYGEYVEVDNIAQTRLPITFNEILTPNGVRIILTADASDRTGSAGLPGTVDNRFWDKYGTGLMMAFATAIVNYSIPTNSDRAAESASAFTDTLTPIAQEDFASRLDIKPIISIPAGEKIVIKPQSHIWFPEIKSSEVVPRPINLQEGKG